MLEGEARSQIDGAFFFFKDFFLFFFFNVNLFLLSFY